MTRLTALLTTLLIGLAGALLVPVVGHAAFGTADRPVTSPVTGSVTSWAPARAGAPMAAAPRSRASRPSAQRCRGKLATLVGRPGKTVRGTPRRDVVVTNGADYIDVRRGNDLVCVTGGRETQVMAGKGADRVVVRQRRGSVWTVLGPGPDTYRGSAVAETVYAARTDTRTGDRHRDDIRTRGGDDRVVVGRPGTANRDVAKLGGGDDDLWLYSVDNRRARLDGGAGTDRFTFMAERGPDPRARYVVDAAAGTLDDRGATTTRFSRFEDYYLFSLTADSLHFDGTDAAESVTLPHETVVSAAMGGGDDTVAIFQFGSTALRTAGSGVDGGDGRDLVSMPEISGDVAADLAAQRILITLDGGDPPYTVPLAGIEDLRLSAYETLTITGDDGPNRLSGLSCSTRISGGGGDDELKADGYAEDIECSQRPAQLFGEDGDDILVGGRFDDLLDGGAGVDSADGAKGVDTCVAETRVRCEA